MVSSVGIQGGHHEIQFNVKLFQERFSIKGKRFDLSWKLELFSLEFRQDIVYYHSAGNDIWSCIRTEQLRNIFKPLTVTVFYKYHWLYISDFYISYWIGNQF